MFTKQEDGVRYHAYLQQSTVVEECIDATWYYKYVVSYVVVDKYCYLQWHSRS